MISTDRREKQKLKFILLWDEDERQLEEVWADRAERPIDIEFDVVDDWSSDIGDGDSIRYRVLRCKRTGEEDGGLCFRLRRDGHSTTFVISRKQAKRLARVLLKASSHNRLK